MPATDSTQDTRIRLIEAAGEVFAERGFHNATVREIVERAGANVAAINYHFGDKRKLYSEVLGHWYQVSVDKYPPNRGVDDLTPAPRKLRTFIESFLLRILDKGKPAWFGRLLAREMMEPTHALDELIDANIRPMWKRLAAILRELAAADATEEQIRHCGMSIVGQILFHHHCRQVLGRLLPQQTYDPRDIEALAEHITSFSLAGIRALTKEGGC